MVFEFISASFGLPVVGSAEDTKIGASVLLKLVVEPGCSIVEELAVTLGATHRAHVGFEVAVRMAPKLVNILVSHASLMSVVLLSGVCIGNKMRSNLPPCLFGTELLKSVANRTLEGVLVWG